MTKHWYLCIALLNILMPTISIDFSAQSLLVSSVMDGWPINYSTDMHLQFPFFQMGIAPGLV